MLLKLKPIKPIDLAMLDRPSSPNTYLACPKGFSAAKPDQEAPIFAQPISKLVSAWTKVVVVLPRMTEIKALSTDIPQLTYVQRSALMGYPDTLTVQFIDLADDMSSVALYSCSQYGYYDIGVNKRRVKHCLQQLGTVMANYH